MPKDLFMTPRSQLTDAERDKLKNWKGITGEHIEKILKAGGFLNTWMVQAAAIKESNPELFNRAMAYVTENAEGPISDKPRFGIGPEGERVQSEREMRGMAEEGMDQMKRMTSDVENMKTRLGGNDPRKKVEDALRGGGVPDIDIRITGPMKKTLG